MADLLRRAQELSAEVRRVRAESESLREEISRRKKNSSNSSKPPSSDIVKPPKEPKAKGSGQRGGQPGHAKHERAPFPPERIDRTVEYELPKEVAKGLRRLAGGHVVQQADWAKRPLEIVEHRAARYVDPRTGRIVIAPLPPEVAKGGLVGPRLSALIAYLKSACHMSYATIQGLLREVWELVLREGELAKVAQKASAALAEPYDQVRQALAEQPHLGIDETDRGGLRPLDGPHATRLAPDRASATSAFRGRRLGQTVPRPPNRRGVLHLPHHARRRTDEQRDGAGPPPCGDRPPHHPGHARRAGTAVAPTRLDRPRHLRPTGPQRLRVYPSRHPRPLHRPTGTVATDRESGNGYPSLKGLVNS